MKTDLSCDIIRDLLPSYVDDICSQATRDWVDAHLHDCPDCQALTRQLRDTALTAKKLEEREFDALKKTRRQLRRESLAGVLLAFGLIFSALAGYWLLVRGGGGRADSGFYGLLALCILVTVNFARSQKPEKPAGRADRLMAVLSVAVTGWMVLLVLYCLRVLIAGGVPFRELSMATDLGAFVRFQLDAGAVLQLVFFVLLLRRLVKQKRRNAWALPLCLAGACLSMLIRNLLGSMDLSFPTLDRQILLYLRQAAVALAMGLGGSLLAVLLERLQSRARE